jgi:hypothetical protein
MTGMHFQPVPVWISGTLPRGTLARVDALDTPAYQASALI